MTREQAEALGRRALAAGFEPTDQCADWCGVRRWQLSSRQGFVPDFRDDATRGILLGQVREAWRDPLVYVKPEPDGGWSTWREGGQHGYFGAFEAESLVFALEAAKNALAKSPTIAPS